MSTILAIETSSELASAALLCNGTTTSREAAGVTTHSQSILPMVQALLADAGIALSDCEAIAFGAGPGSFTGVRTACGIAQGLAYGADKPLLPTVTLLALAQACREQTGASDVLAVLDARMGEVYWAQYRFVAEWQIIIPPTLSAAVDVLPQGDVIACGNGLQAYAANFATRSFFANGLKDMLPHAVQIATLGATAFAQGLGVSASAAEPLYLRNKVALTTSERLEKAAKEAA
ncbi:MAG: tRNA (adenosine(37)-N6)-threonylcarbamoyltransferase complex dimerization subunit type 1 TsaB [Pseudomonadota bacterium]